MKKTYKAIIALSALMLVTSLFMISSVSGDDIQNFYIVKGTLKIDDQIADPEIEITIEFYQGNTKTGEVTGSTFTYDGGFNYNIVFGPGYEGQNAHIKVYGINPDNDPTFTVDGNTIFYYPPEPVDTAGEINIDTNNIVNELPVANSGGPYNGIIDNSVSFDGSASTDSDGTIVGYRWDFNNDGSFDTSWQTTPTTTYTYTTAGTYTVKLQVKDDSDGVDSDTTTATIADEDTTAPSKVTGLSVSDAKDGKLNLNWDAATDNIGIDHYIIYRNDVNIGTSTGRSYQDTGLTNGQSYSYKVSAVDTSDNEGEKSDPKSGTPTKSQTTTNPPSGGGGAPPITPTNQPPVADAGDQYQGLKDEVITLDGSSSSDPDNDNLEYRWDFNNDGSYETDWSTDPTATNTWTSTGTYIVKLKVKDTSGLTDTDTEQVIITTANEEPTNLEITGPSEGDKDTEYEFTVTATDPDGDNIKYIIKWDDGTDNTITQEYSSGTSYTAKHTWTKAGKYTIEVTAKDTSNSVTTTTHEISIDKENIQNVDDDEIPGYFIDTDGDGTYDEYYNTNTGETHTVSTEDGKYIVDGSYIYDPDTGNMNTYSSTEPVDDDDDNQEGTDDDNPNNTTLYVVGIIGAIALLLILFLFTRKREKSKK